ncbi:hypothetical protein SAMN05421541_11694 [Actinoplanes philippinensis]|uniref:Uncharacterized protein n=1 Tax=Actinoplanes philippinensis TaxID=35752 RepID=A0A1I2KH92_9ACTN|nr:hypothetical protein SAMN05421541_11694 [Actinoplanes philippinensis]
MTPNRALPMFKSPGHWKMGTVPSRSMYEILGIR